MAKIGSMELIVILIDRHARHRPGAHAKAARMLGKAVGSFKKYMNDATSDPAQASDEFREVTDEIADAQKTVRKAFKDADDEISKTRGEAEEKLNPKKKKSPPRRKRTRRTGAQAAEGRSEGGGGRAAGRRRNQAQPRRPRKTR